MAARAFDPPSSDRPAPTRRQKIAVLAASLVFSVLLIEGLSYLGTRFLVTRGVVCGSAPPADYAGYLEERDPILGWPAPSSIGTDPFDAAFSRITPAFPDPATKSCVALFGDSFTFGDEVAAEHAYGNVLSQLLGCRVSNYGIGGYGTDQAFLRYRDRIGDDAPIVVLGIFSENIVRNVNQLRGLYTGRGNDLGFKPRFIEAGDGGVIEVPMPTPTEAQIGRFPGNAQEVLKHEYFLPGGDANVVFERFPYTLTVARAAAHFRVQARVRGEPYAWAFYDEDHPSRALQVTTGIVREFAQVARSRNQRPVLLLIPDMEDIAASQDGRPFPYEPLKEALQDEGLEMIDAGEEFVKRLDGDDPCRLYTQCTKGHFFPEGYGWLAETVRDGLLTQGLIDQAKRRGKDVEQSDSGKSAADRV